MRLQVLQWVLRGVLQQLALPWVWEVAVAVSEMLWMLQCGGLGCRGRVKLGGCCTFAICRGCLFRGLGRRGWG